MLPSPSLLDPDTATWLLRDADGNLRAALICWGIVLSGFFILRIPRDVLLGCLIVAGAVVGLAATVVNTAADQAAAGRSEPQVVAARTPSATALRSPAAQPVPRERPY